MNRSPGDPGARDTEPSAQTVAARLAHDVGKYASRTARNLPTEEIPKVLIEMLIKDLFAIDGHRSAATVFDELTALNERLASDERIAACRVMFREIEQLEPAIREHDQTAVRRAAALALELDSQLRTVALELAEVNP